MKQLPIQLMSIYAHYITGMHPVSPHTLPCPVFATQPQPPQVEQFSQEQQQQVKTAVQTLPALDNQLLYEVEVSQAIQNLNHTVPLVADKSRESLTICAFQSFLQRKRQKRD